MARLELAAPAQADLDRLFEFLAAEDAVAAGATLSVIFDGLYVLERHPMIGRPVENNLRELVISRGKSGYESLYDYFEADDVVLVLALRHQREAGFPERR